MKTLLYVLAFVLLDALVPHSCRPEGYVPPYERYYDEDDSLYYDADSLYEDSDSIGFEQEADTIEDSVKG